VTPNFPNEDPAEAIPLNFGAEFEPDQCGTIRGQVFWDGPIPEPHSFRDVGVAAPASIRANDAKNPLLPRIDSRGKAVCDAVIFLRKIDAARSRPLQFPPLLVEMRDSQISIFQGDSAPHVSGFVRMGDSIEMISHSSFEMLRARGAAFFTLAFPEPERNLKRALSKPGVVELSSAAGNFWARSFIHVMKHPYITRTAEDGTFALTEVPDGNYEIVCWLPNWNSESFDRDPENFGIARLRFAAPLEKSTRVMVRPRQETNIQFQIQSSDFAGKRE